MGDGNTFMVEPVSFHFTIGAFNDICVRRKIFPDNTSSRSHKQDNVDTLPDSNLCRSKAKQARLKRAARRRQEIEDE
jgi:hypothetical protein